MKTIDITDTNEMMRYGTDIQISLAELSGILMENLRQTREDEVIGLLNELLEYLDALNDGSGLKDGFFAVKKKDALTVERDYEKAVKKVESIMTELEKHRIELAKESAVLDMLFTMNREYLKQLDETAETVRNVVAGLQDGYSAQEADKFTVKNAIECLSKRLKELELSKSVAGQQMATVQVLRGNLDDVAVKLQTALYTTIPLWKNQIVLAVNEAYSAKKSMTDTAISISTNNILIDSLNELKSAEAEAKKTRSFEET